MLLFLLVPEVVTIAAAVAVVVAVVFAVVVAVVIVVVCCEICVESSSSNKKGETDVADRWFQPKTKKSKRLK